LPAGRPAPERQMTAVSTKSSTTSPPLGGEPRESDALALPRAGFGSAPALALAASCGLVVVALANNGAREGAAWAEPLFWLALAAIFAPIAWRLLSHAPSRRER